MLTYYICNFFSITRKTTFFLSHVCLYLKLLYTYIILYSKNVKLIQSNKYLYLLMNLTKSNSVLITIKELKDICLQIKVNFLLLYY